ncbi:E3 ubiquitin-protein ligase TRIM63-like isoform X2 [Corythoichthys intestinalis]|uniref:E3 ubiquitin-protein ligase TRIM63-like isoform X2 n=1 Tax=Corythoichthys intestinalis TaxID=161448 RepID=UPI0025A4FB25|nr:E3 ubiquitin-protein ligase TRIM63-like isoform X2 [Corythoichthys intestinalis]
MESLEKQLLCPICLEIFSKPVVILPCQHNLCRKCANDVFQAANPYLSSRGGSTAPSGGRFRCPSCRHEVVLDRHGVFGLQRNLLVENIIDMFKQGSASRKETSPPAIEVEHPVCEHHDQEKINIYCLSCGIPTCSLCKVFGAHKDCRVAPLDVVFAKQKVPASYFDVFLWKRAPIWNCRKGPIEVVCRGQAELSECIAALVGANERIRAVMGQLDDTRRALDDNGRRQKSKVCESFDRLFAVLEARKGELDARIGAEQQEKLDYMAGLRRKYKRHLENTAELLENAMSANERAEMAAFLQDSKPLLQKMAVGSDTSNLEKVQSGYEKMEHFRANFQRQKRALMAVCFLQSCSRPADGGDVRGATEDRLVEDNARKMVGMMVPPSEAPPLAKAPPPLPLEATPAAKTPPPDLAAPQAESQRVDDASKHVFSFSWLNNK